MTDRTFSLEARLHTCDNCAAPLTVPAQGGDVTCEYCGVTTRITARREYRHEAAAAPSEEEEKQRLRRLHQKALDYTTDMNPYAFYRAPAGLEHVVKMDGTHGKGHPETLVIARDAYRTQLRECLQNPRDRDAQRRLYWIGSFYAQGLAASGNYQGQRAVLETALENLPDPNHQHMVFTELAKAARNVGDLENAQKWLMQCQSAPEILDLDSAYRTTLASLYLVEKRPKEALKLVGAKDGDVPFDPSRLLGSTLLRVASLEMMGEQDEAEREMHRIVEVKGRDRTERMLPGGGDHLIAARSVFNRMRERKQLPGVFRGDVKKRLTLILVLGVLAIAAAFAVSASSCLGS